jgi:hypothetical protein
MKLTDYPTPRTDAAAETRIVRGRPREITDAEVARQLEREAAAWRAVAETIHSASNLDELQAAHEAFDALKNESV